MSTPIRAAVAALALVIVPLTLTACAASAPPAVEETAEPTTAPEKEADTEPATGFTLVFDDTGAVSVEVPDAWIQVNGAPITDTTLQLSAAPDLAGFAGAVHGAYDVPGVTILATSDSTVSDEEYITKYVTEFGPDCSDGETDVYDDTVYSGQYLYLPGCGSAGADVVIVVAHDAERVWTVLVSMTLVSEEDKTTNRDQILSTFYVE